MRSRPVYTQPEQRYRRQYKLNTPGSESDSLVSDLSTIIPANSEKTSGASQVAQEKRSRVLREPIRVYTKDHLNTLERPLGSGMAHQILHSAKEMFMINKSYRIAKLYRSSTPRCETGNSCYGFRARSGLHRSALRFTPVACG